MMKILLINGPNLNLLGKREPHLYGATTLAEVEKSVIDKFSPLNWQLNCFQSNSEAEIVDFLHQNLDADGIIINPASLSHYSYALRDALIAKPIPFIEVHISNIHAREKFRQKSVLSDVAVGFIIGCGVYGYILAADFLISKFSK